MVVEKELFPWADWPREQMEDYLAEWQRSFT